MELAYNLFVSAFTAILLSFLVAKLVTLAVSGGDVGGGNGLCTGLDNGDKQKGPIGGGVEEGKLEKRLKVEASKSKKKRLKKISSDTVLVSEFKGKTQPTPSANISGPLSKADDFIDDCKESGYKEKDLEFPGIDVDDPVKNGGQISSYEKPLNERFLQEMRDCREYDDVIRIVPCENEKGKDRIEPKKDDTIDDQDEHRRFLTSVEKADVQNEDNVISGNGGGEMEISDGEEWEGIERNELEKDFVRAMNYVECIEKEGRLNKLASDVIMQFNDLRKVAMEGPCHDPKISVRAKWNSWQKLGSMNPEEAMEKYVTLLSDKVPGWIDADKHPYVESKISPEKDDIFRSSHTAAVNAPLTVPLACTNESKLGEELVTGTGGGDLAGRSSSVNKENFHVWTTYSKEPSAQLCRCWLVVVWIKKRSQTLLK